jgi:archaellum component FlaC
MSEEQPQNLNGKKTFEERVFARFDALDARFNGVDARLDTVDVRLEKLEARSYDTKPIWQKALTAIVEIGKDLGEFKNRVTVIETAIGGLAADVGTLKTDVGTLKTDVGTLKTDVGTLKTDVGTLKTDVGTLKTDVGTLKTDVGTLKTDVGTLKTDVAETKITFGRMTNEFVDIRRELRENVRHELSLILKFLIEDRQDIRDAEDRIRNLETKLA